MLKNFIENEHYLFLDEVSDWKEALRKGIIPLVKDGSVDEVYGDQIIEAVEKHGPYIIIMPGIAMPHSQEGAIGVNKTTISFMKVEKPVVFDENDPDSYAHLFFTLASCDHNAHLDNMSKLMDILMNEELLSELMLVKSLEDLQAVSDKYGV